MIALCRIVYLKCDKILCQNKFDFTKFYTKLVIGGNSRSRIDLNEKTRDYNKTYKNKYGNKT